MRGAFRTYRFDVTSLVRQGGTNALAVEVFRPESTDLAINWWDWAPSPPDLNMGLFQDVFVRRTGPVTLDDLRVTTKVPSPKHADVTVTALVTNGADEPRHIAVAVALADRTAEKEMALGAHESKAVVFEPAAVPALAIENPHLWRKRVRSALDARRSSRSHLVGVR